MSRGTLQRTFTILSTVAFMACSEQLGPTETSASQSVNQSTPLSISWQEQARTLASAANMSPLAAARVYAALSLAQYKAVMAASAAVTGGGRSALEANRGAVAGSSAQVLTFFFPSAAIALEQRVVTDGSDGPGNVHPQFTQGLGLGRGVGDQVVQRTQADKVTTPWTGTVPTGPGSWIANGAPAGATFGGVTPYLLSSGSQFRSPPPPAVGSAAFSTDLAEIKTIATGRTAAQTATALYWNFPTGTFTPPGYWDLTAANYIASHGMDERAATHAFALMNVAQMDALVGCWDSKYFYWVQRPSQADASITMSFGLPNHPSYPSGHSCSSAAAATVLASLFPDKATELSGWVTEAGLSRMYAGIHSRFDITAGANLGNAVGQWAISRDQQGGLLAIH